ncbi:uncharacterized protein LOC108244369 [Kryptolebias marmoratus]|uniref:uncharacterized protein LOC108244369 n=1 Tax=Kryptolebias marmoratus TaxID=37003 RepID=UPI0018ACDDB8|nr:uncharacterized protein LOC108244369 [Kryptolebias marmoratus]
MENHHNTLQTGGQESEANLMSTSLKDEAAEQDLEDSGVKTEADSMDTPVEDQHSGEIHGCSEEEAVNASVPPTTSERDRPAEESCIPKDTSSAPADIRKSDHHLTLVLIGDTSSIETGSKNNLLDHNEQTKFSPRLYDLCGQEIHVINLLGLKDIEKNYLNQEVNAFLLLIPNDLHDSHYKSGVQWLEETFGKQSLAYLMTVVTHNAGENCEGALEDLRANSLVEQRCHTCTRSMSEAVEMVDLLEKINIMVSENSPSCYRRLMGGENADQNQQLESRSDEEQKMNSSVFQETQTEEEVLEGATETESGSVNELRVLSEKNGDSNTSLDKGTTEEKLSDDKEKVGTFVQNLIVNLFRIALRWKSHTKTKPKQTQL